MAASSVRRLAGRAWDARVWRRGHGALMWHQGVHRKRNVEAGFTDQGHLLAAARWLERAQDAVQDGGVAGRYRLDTGWTSSYPETTGYLIPTFLALSEEPGSEAFRARARRWGPPSGRRSRTPTTRCPRSAA